MIYSSTRGIDAEAFDTSFLERQIMFIMVGTALMVGAVLVPYDRLRFWAPIFYGGGMLGLVGVLAIGVTRNGAKVVVRLGGFQLQPSEFLKVAFIVLLASYVSSHDGELSAAQLAVALGISGLPILLIMRNPTWGQRSSLSPSPWACCSSGAPGFSHIVVLTLVGLGSVALIWNSGALETYQQDRLTSFIDPASARPRPRYQQAQATIAIGSGGVSGQGFGQGGQTRASSYPSSTPTSSSLWWARSSGSSGRRSVWALCAPCLANWRTAKKAADLFGSLICVGVMTMIVFQMFQSVGMTVGIMPITGIPVPFLSYGGSSALTSFVAVGLVLNVHMRRYQVVVSRPLGLTPSGPFRPSSQSLAANAGGSTGGPDRSADAASGEGCGSTHPST